MTEKRANCEILKGGNKNKNTSPDEEGYTRQKWNPAHIYGRDTMP